MGTPTVRTDPQPEYLVESPNVVAALALPRALERGVHGAALRELYTDDVVSIEHPNAISPRIDR